jgi:HK97 family phage major capsid protein
MPSLLNKLKAFGGMREVARQVETTSGGPISWATLDDTSSTSELVAENISASPGDLAFGAVTSTAAKFSSKIVPISFELLKDSRIDIEKVVLDALAVRLARAMNYYFTIGTGIGQPQGAVGAASLGFQMAVGNTGRVDSDGLMSLFHSVDLAYRYSPSAAFMMHDQTFKAVKQLKDSNSRPLWLPATESALAGDGDFDTLMGARLVINQDMSPMAANAKSILFGDWSKYLIRDVRESLIMRFTDSAYAKFGQVGFLAFARADGRFIDAGNANSISLAYLQNSST